MSHGVAIAEENFVATFARMGTLLPRAAVASRPGVTHVHSGAAVASFNPSIVHGPIDDPETLLDDAADFHARHGSPAWVVQARASDSERLAAAAAERGLAAAFETPYMVLDAIPDVSPSAGLVIEQVHDVAGLRRHLEIVTGAFGMSFASIETICDAVLLDERFGFFVAELDGVAAASSLVAVSSGAGARCAGVYNVATLPPFRGRGLGRVLTEHAAAVGRDDHGCTVAALQASPMGRALYERMGYREVTRWTTWTRAG